MNIRDVDVVILNYRTPLLAVEAARSAYESGAESIIVIEHHSQDDSFSVLEKGVGDFAKIIQMHENHGFGGGNNRGANFGNRPLVLFQNADTKLHKQALAQMVSVFNQDSRIGIVGPALYYPDGRPQASAYFFITPVRIINAMLGFDILAKKLRSSSLSANIDFKHNGNYTGQVESLYGACLLVRRKAFKEVGGFDETFYLYCEETDLIFRMARKGWKAYRVGEASVTHHEGEYRKEFPILATVLYQESRWIYAKKNFSLVGKLITFLFSVLGLVIRYIFSLESSRRKRYGVALGFWFGRTPSADPRKQIRQNNKENL